MNIQILEQFFLTEPIYPFGADVCINEFFERRHCGECFSADAIDRALPYTELVECYYTPCYDRPKSFFFHSEIYDRVLQMLDSVPEQNVLLRITQNKLSGKLLKMYPMQRFSVLLACACALSDQQISQLADLRHRKRCWDILDFFLLNPSCEVFKPVASRPPVSCTIDTDEGARIGKIIGSEIILTGSEHRYIIL